MAAIMEYKLDDNANEVIWLDDNDGKIRVMLETGGYWKVVNTDEPWKRGPHEFHDNQEDVTDLLLGPAVLSEWRALGEPRIEHGGTSANEYCRNIAWAPKAVLDCPHLLALRSLPEEFRRLLIEDREYSYFDDDERPKLITALETLSTRIPARIRLPRIVIFAAAPWKRGQAMRLIAPLSEEGDDCFIYFFPTLEDQSQEEVDFTVAHEVAHATLRHHVDMTIDEAEASKDYLEMRDEIQADRLVVAWGYSVPAYRHRSDGQSNQDECQSNEEPRV